jgi:hypothetical protein
MSEVNPFASPLSEEPAGAVAAEDWRSRCLYRKGRLLVMHKEAVLPDRCVKSNQPAHGRRLKRKLAWHHPVLYLILPADVLVYLITVLILRKRATIYVGLSEEWFRRRRRALVIGWTLIVGGAAMLGVGLASIGQSPRALPAITLGLLVALGGLIYVSRAARIVQAKWITNHFVWLKGVHPDYLATLPPWPYEP